MPSLLTASKFRGSGFSGVRVSRLRLRLEGVRYQVAGVGAYWMA